ncbi:MAG: 2-phosphosulfolactate phosphatase [Thermoguttaceae bacterium]|nr:2-phosphosulfolactate phosphatase [Thermoguttaceae bacterium]
MKKIDVYPLPDLAPELPINGVSVAVDVLRATTTIATALAAGAEKVVPFETVEETLEAKRVFLARRPEDRDRVKLGGERNAVPIDGFDFGNSPNQYVPDALAGKTLLFTTTNGTRAILSCRGTVLLAAFVNANAVVERILREESDVVSIVCAGTDGQYTEEDLLLAGLLVDRLTLRSSDYALNVQAEVSREQWRRRRSTPLVDALKESRGGQNLRRAKLLGDVADAAKLDSLDVVPEFRVGEIKLDSAFQK